MKKNILMPFLGFVAIVFTLFSCTKTKEPVGLVAILFPQEQGVPRWIEESEQLKACFFMYNFGVSIGYAEKADGVDGQASQIDQVRSLGCRYLILASVDTQSEEINVSLATFRSAGGKVICYDRLQQNTVDVDSYISVLPQDVGALQGAALAGIVTEQVLSVEFLAGPVTDDNSKLFFDGMKSAIEGRTITTPSGRTTFAQVAQPNWTTDAAYQYTKTLLDQFYADGALPSAIMASNDAQAAAVAKAVKEHQPAVAVYPIITGQDNTLAARARIINGEQTMTVDKNGKEYVLTSFALVHDIWINGGEDTLTKSTISNGAKDVPCIKITPRAIYKADI